LVSPEVLKRRRAELAGHPQAAGSLGAGQQGESGGYLARYAAAVLPAAEGARLGGPADHAPGGPANPAPGGPVKGE